MLLAEAQTAYYEAKYVTKSEVSDMLTYVKSYLNTHKTSAEETVTITATNEASGKITVGSVAEANIDKDLKITSNWTAPSGS